MEEGKGARIMLFAKPVGEGQGYGVGLVEVDDECLLAVIIETSMERKMRKKTESFKFCSAIVL